MRVQVTEVYAHRYPAHKRYAGQQGEWLGAITDGAWAGYVRARLDCDDTVGLFKPDELEKLPAET